VQTSISAVAYASSPGGLPPPATTFCPGTYISMPLFGHPENAFRQPLRGWRRALPPFTAACTEAWWLPCISNAVALSLLAEGALLSLSGANGWRRLLNRKAGISFRIKRLLAFGRRQHGERPGLPFGVASGTRFSGAGLNASAAGKDVAAVKDRPQTCLYAGAVLAARR